jgi:hypothetical protein
LVDVVCGFHVSCDVSNVVVVMDLMSKRVFYFDCVSVPSSELIFELTRHEILRCFWFPEMVLSDRGPPV